MAPLTESELQVIDADLEPTASPYTKVDELASILNEFTDHKINLVSTHHFIPGFYCRQTFMPKDSIVISKIHNSTHPWVQVYGDSSVLVEGKTVNRFMGYNCGITTPGTRRVLFMNEDTLWVTFHRTDSTDLKVIEAELIEPREIIPIAVNSPLMEEIAEIKAIINEQKQISQV